MNDEELAEQALDDALDRLPRPAAPDALVRSLRAKHLPASPRRARPWTRVVLAFAAALAIVVAVLAGRASRADDTVVAEAVADHLRVLYASRPIEIESGGIHQVKPWFAGRLDFAPTMPFGGDDDFVLEGGSIAYFVDRKAAAFQFKRRLHPITVFVFPSANLAWPAATRSLGRVRASEATVRGFHVITWRDGDLGYAAVSDVDAAELADLVGRIAH